MADLENVKKAYSRHPKDPSVEIHLLVSSRAAALRAIEWLHNAKDELSAPHSFDKGKHYVVFTKEHD